MTKIGDIVDELTTKSIAMLKSSIPIHDYIGFQVTTKELYDRVVGIRNIHIQLYKIEAQREIQITWSEVARNSGGEGFLSAFVILSSLLYDKTGDGVQCLFQCPNCLHFRKQTVGTTNQTVNPVPIVISLPSGLSRS